jgi:hypothetical protein
MQGLAYCNQRDYSAAEATYSRGLELDPTFMRLHLLRAEVRLEQDDWNSAFEDLGLVQKSNLADVSAEHIDAAVSGDLSCENFVRDEPSGAASGIKQ